VGVACCDRQAMTDDISATASSKNRGLSAARCHGSEALRPTDAEGLACLWDYVKQHGTSQVPHRHKTTDGFLLGRWVSRRRKNRGESPALDQLLESLPGWTWAPHERGFEERLAHYKHVAEAGTLNRYRALYVWASEQRRLVREGKVSADRLEQLRTAGVI
jgi:Helicase associated domain